MAELQRIAGLSDLAAALRELPLRIGRNVLRRAVSSAAAVIRDEARQRAPVLTGEMKRDIQIKRERVRTDVIALYSVFVRAGKKSRLAGKGRNVDKDSYYWRFVEFGTSKMAAHPFMRPAFETKKMAAVEAIKASLTEGIPREVQKLPGVSK